MSFYTFDVVLCYATRRRSGLDYLVSVLCYIAVWISSVPSYFYSLLHQEMTEPCALPVVCVWYAGSLQMNLGKFNNIWSRQVYVEDVRNLEDKGLHILIGFLSLGSYTDVNGFPEWFHGTNHKILYCATSNFCMVRKPKKLQLNFLILVCYFI